MNDIPMQIKHQELICDGLKTSTLRSKPFASGVYRMVAAGGRSIGAVSVKPLREICWADLNIHDKDDIAYTEGYESVAAFEAFMRGFARGMGRKFISGERNLYLHSLTMETTND